MTKITSLYKTVVLSLALAGLAACSTNPATGARQFTAFMPASSEAKVGAETHQQILEKDGEVDNPRLRAYVRSVGERLVPNTERDDVTYTFTVLDSPEINAFAAPGGYIYITRGIMTLMQDEAELAAVIGHEIGHVTARHTAARYSQGVVTGLGSAIIAAAVGSSEVNRVLGIGGQLYLSSYSRSQERESDNLGVRYIARAGYDPMAMSDFHAKMLGYENFRNLATGRGQSGSGFDYFSTHPLSAERVADSRAEAARFPAANMRNRDAYLDAIDGMDYGYNRSEGFRTGNLFVHPLLEFAFAIPDNHTLQNSTDEVVIASRREDGPFAVFTGGRKKPSQSIGDFVAENLLGGGAVALSRVETMEINGMPAATAEIAMQYDGRPAEGRIVAVAHGNEQIYLFQFVFPRGTSQDEMLAMRSMAYSFKRLTMADKARYVQPRIKIITARPGDTIGNYVSGFPYTDGLNVERFRMMNAMGPNEELVPGRRYKTIVQ